MPIDSISTYNQPINTQARVHKPRGSNPIVLGTIAGASALGELAIDGFDVFDRNESLKTNAKNCAKHHVLEIKDLLAKGVKHVTKKDNWAENIKNVSNKKFLAGLLLTYTTINYGLLKLFNRV